jgi:hypothetical protein
MGVPEPVPVLMFLVHAAWVWVDVFLLESKAVLLEGKQGE